MKLGARLIQLIFLLSFISCSALTVSTVQESEYVIGEGRVGDDIWSEDLVFKRLSWFYELTLMYDFYIAEIPVSSNYRRWFTPGEALSSNNCGRFYIAAVYATRDRRVSQNDIWKQFDTNKIKFTNVNGFYQNLSFSENFLTNSFNLYKFWGVCVKGNSSSIITKFSLPGYASKQIKL